MNICNWFSWKKTLKSEALMKQNVHLRKNPIALISKPTLRNTVYDFIILYWISSIKKTLVEIGVFSCYINTYITPLILSAGMWGLKEHTQTTWPFSKSFLTPVPDPWSWPAVPWHLWRACQEVPESTADPPRQNLHKLREKGLWHTPSSISSDPDTRFTQNWILYWFQDFKSVVVFLSLEKMPRILRNKIRDLLSFILL